MEFLKDKRFYWSLLLTLIFVAYVVFYALIRFVDIPLFQARLNIANNNVNELKKYIESYFSNDNAKDILIEYDQKLQKVKIIKSARDKVFVIWEKKIDFFPQISKIFEFLKNHKHNDVTFEWISISEIGDIVIPIFWPSYTVLAKQFVWLKEAFAWEKEVMIIDLNVNTFIRQEIEIIEKNSKGVFEKIRKPVSKATITWKINSKYFDKALNDSIDTKVQEEDLSWLFEDNFAKKASLIDRIANVYAIIMPNIKRELIYIKKELFSN